MIGAVEKRTFTLSKDIIQQRVGTRTATYHRLLGGLFFLDDAGQEVLQTFKQDRDVPDSVLQGQAKDRKEELIQQFIARRVLVESPTPGVQRSTPEIEKKVNIIQLVLANACNFGCTYCFEGVQGKEMSVEDEFNKVEESRIIAKDSIKVNIEDSMYASKERFEHQYSPQNRSMKPEDGIAYVRSALKVARSEGVREVMIQFFGGEPLLNWRTINAVLEHFGRGEKDDMVIHYSTVTNGSLITDEVAKTFGYYEVAVCVSVDSPNSPSRPLKNGDDSMPVVMKGLRKLQQHNNRVALNAALTSATWDDFNEGIVDLAVEVGAKEIGVVVDFDPTFYSEYGAGNIVDRLWQVVQYGREKGVVLTGYWHQIFQVMLGFDTVSHRGFKNCSAKGAQFSIEPNGSVFSCKAGSTLLGDIRDETKILNEEPYLEHAKLRRENPAFCNGCEIEGFCGGLCLGPLEKKFGSVEAVEESACDFYRGITRKHIEAIQPYEVATFDLDPTT
ncbi:thioether cross-link-forming SCIFF peptide maturase [Marinobacter nanhaiticus D15-8W]|uniref:radical SAM/SPASM domain-containing protein n=1 Tax=Marinobacter nanhaiticus TaxID=1305740 RepID=UPI00146146C4|nr:radical SAM protein [Marinobacter nanhaiticus]BES73120.1 thioether cross-link-forming SCIFF peptide maturase [Marinobacter nanhaiticus D15-8W]